MVNLEAQSFCPEEEEVKEEDCDLYERECEETTEILLAQLLVTSSFTPRDFSAFSQAFFLISTLM